MTRAALLLVVAVLGSACGATIDHATPSATVTVAPTVAKSPASAVTATIETTRAATPTSVATATSVPLGGLSGMKAWDVPPRTGVPSVDALVVAMTSGDAATVAAFIERGLVTEPCGLPGEYVRCAAGIQPGTPTQSISVAAGCHFVPQRMDRAAGDVARLAGDLTRPVTSLSFVIGEDRSRIGGDRYRVVFLNVRDGSSEAGWELGIAGDGLESLIKLQSPAAFCSFRNLADLLRQRTGSSTLLIPPPP